MSNKKCTNLTEYLFSLNFTELKKILLLFLLVVMTVTAATFIFLYRHYQISAYQTATHRDTSAHSRDHRIGAAKYSDSVASSKQINDNTIKATIGLTFLFGFVLLIVAYIFAIADKAVDQYQCIVEMNNNHIGERMLYGVQTSL
ncbi:MAG: hypothetical protein WCI39_06165 [Gallionellaceae bacterium]